MVVYLWEKEQRLPICKASSIRSLPSMLEVGYTTTTYTIGQRYLSSGCTPAVRSPTGTLRKSRGITIFVLEHSQENSTYTNNSTRNSSKGTRNLGSTLRCWRGKGSGPIIRWRRVRRCLCGTILAWMRIPIEIEWRPISDPEEAEDSEQDEHNDKGGE